MRAKRPWRWVWRTAGIAVVLIFLSLASVPMWAPSVAAAVCPSCYGMQPIAENVYVNAATPETQRSALLALMSEAEAPVAAFFGPLSRRRTVLLCNDELCEKRLGGLLEGTGRVRAFAYDAAGYPVLRFSPRGLSATIIAHELTHVEVHKRIGFVNHMIGRLPAWFDEGLAVLISDDHRYIKPGNTAAERCRPAPVGALPVTPFAWGAALGKSPWVYTSAVCQVMLWMESNGGKDGVLAAIAGVGAGKRFQLPPI